jgi:hypothetical protein
MGKLINQFSSDPTLPDDFNLVGSLPDNAGRKVSLALLRELVSSKVHILTEKFFDLSYAVGAINAAISALVNVNSQQDALIANKSDIGHSHEASDITDFATAVAASSSITLQDEGSALGNARAFNFVGAGVIASLSAETATILVSGLGAGGGSSDVWDTIDLSSWDALY